MEEYTNSFDGSNLFVDTPEETTEEVTEPAEPTEPTTEPAPDPAAEPVKDETAEEPTDQTLRIVYNGSKKVLTHAEAVTLAQKGMNYDKVVESLNAQTEKLNAQNDSLKELERWAKQAGMSTTEYVAHLQATRHTQMLRDEIRAIQTKYPDIPEDAAKEMAEARMKDVEADEQRAAQQRQEELDKTAQEPWDDFVKRFPDMDDISKIPAEVLSEIDTGIRPVEAMQRYQIRDFTKKIEELTTKVKQLEQNQKNKETALPSVSTTRKEEEIDPFLVGLFS